MEGFWGVSHRWVCTKARRQPRRTKLFRPLCLHCIVANDMDNLELLLRNAFILFLNRSRVKKRSILCAVSICVGRKTKSILTVMQEAVQTVVSFGRKIAVMNPIFGTTMICLFVMLPKSSKVMTALCQSRRNDGVCCRLRDRGSIQLLQYRETGAMA